MDRVSLQPGESLATGQFLRHFTFVVIMQNDGNLVLYGQGPNGQFPIWASQTQGSGGHICTMQPDGNLVIYNNKKHAVWSSGTNGFRGAIAQVTGSGAFVIQNPAGEPIYWQNGQLTGFGPQVEEPVSQV